MVSILNCVPGNSPFLNRKSNNEALPLRRKETPSLQRWVCNWNCSLDFLSMCGDLSKVKLFRERGRATDEMQLPREESVEGVIVKLGRGVNRSVSTRERQARLIVACVSVNVEDSNDLIDIFIEMIAIDFV